MGCFFRYLRCHLGPKPNSVASNEVSVSRLPDHSVNPRDYLTDAISRMPYMQKATHEELAAMLPHRWKLKHPGSVMVDFRATQGNPKKK